MNFLEVRVETAIAHHKPSYPLRFRVHNTGVNYWATDDQGAVRIQLRRRTSYPGTYCYTTSNGGVILGCGNPRSAEDDEFLQIAISSQGEIIVKRDAFCVVPLFYGMSEGVVSMSNDYETALSGLPSVTLHEPTVLECMIPCINHTRTIWKELSILGERHVLYVSQAGRLVVTPPNARPWLRSSETPPSDPKQFPVTMRSHLSKVIRRFEDRPTAFMVSGGLDSSMLPLYLAHERHEIRGSGISLLYADASRESQCLKLEALQKATGLHILTEQLDEPQNALLANHLHEPRPFYLFEEPFVTPLRRMARALAQQGVEFLCNGIGGDELCENIVSVEEEMEFGEYAYEYRRSLPLPPFYTAAARDGILAATPLAAPYPKPLLSISWHGAQISGNNAALANGIWPLSPFADLDLFNYCQGLPIHYRANKNIFRAWCQAHQMPQTLYNAPTNESFKDSFSQVLCSGMYDQLIAWYAQHSYLERLGYIDTQKLLNFFRGCKAQPLLHNRHKWLVKLYVWLCLEINLHATRNWHPSGHKAITPSA